MIRKGLILQIVIATSVAVWSVSAGAVSSMTRGSAEVAMMRTWIHAMKEQPRGPFKRIRWFCEDGTILPPTPYACAAHGGGRQHGEWNDKTRLIRDAGYPIGTVLAAVNPLEFVEASNSTIGLLQSILLEQFLIRVDDGWILRQARHYRGAFQADRWR